ASSADGAKLIALAGGESLGPLFISSDAGKSWNRSGTVEGYWTWAACSADGHILAAVEGGYKPGRIYTCQPQATVAPVLSIRCSGPEIVISWPLTSTPFVLEQNSGTASTWTSVSNEVTVAEGHNQVVIRQPTG